MDMPASSFGDWVKRRRRMIDLTQTQLAAQVACSVTALQKIERNERRPSRQLAQRLAEFLEIPPAQRDLFLKVARRERMEEVLPPLTEAPIPIQALPVSSTLPVPLAPLIGREIELGQITSLLDDPRCRLLTLTGSGGIGKTRLALEVAHCIQRSWTHGACFVSLSSVSAPEFIVPAIAEALSLSMAGSFDPGIQLIHYLAEKQMLLVLDNFEHLLDGVEILSKLLQNAPGIKLLVTSRELLHLQAEWMFEVQGLTVPESVTFEDLSTSSAVTLFSQRAQQSRAGFTLSSDDRVWVVKICQLVQGLPLALELAATWVRTLSCREIADEIERGLGFLAAGGRDLPERHRSMTAVFDHSWKLLTEAEQACLRRLSVFRGGFTRAAAESIARTNLTMLSSLVDKSLIQHNDATSGRFDLHELVRQYAAVHFDGHPAEKRETHIRFGEYYLNLLIAQETRLRSSHQKESLAALTADIDNLRSAWDIAVSGESIELLRCAAGPLYFFYELLQYFEEAEAAYKRAIDMLRTRLLRANQAEVPLLEGALAEMLNYQAFFNLRPGRNREALEIFEVSTAMLRSLHEPQALAFALVHSGIVRWALGDFENASLELRSGLSLSRKTEQAWLHALAAGMLGGVLYDQGKYEESYEFLKDAMATFQAMGDPYFILLVGSYFARTAQSLGYLSETEKVLREGLQIARESGNRWSIGLALERLGAFEQATGHFQEARQWLDEGLKLLREVGDRWSLSWVLNDMSQLALTNHEKEEAERYAIEAIGVATEAGNHPSEINALVMLATIRAQQGKNVPALNMVRYVLQHPSSTNDAKARAMHLRTELEAEISAEEIQIASISTLPDSAAFFIADAK